MKIVTSLLTLSFLFSVSYAQTKPLENQKSRRIEKIINSQWTFNYLPGADADKGCEAPGFDDSKWPAISIPHTWNVFETTGVLHPFIRDASEADNPYWWHGWGWYRKHFSISREYADRKIFIEFEGVQKYCKVWINGKYLGDHKGGYGSFDFDVTSFIKPGEVNVIAVAVNNRQKDDFRIPPMAAGNFDVYGGIYRDVTLVLKDKLYVPMQGSASHEGGTFVTTPRVSEKEAVVSVQTWVKNDYPEKKSCTLQTSVIDATNKIIQVIKSEAEVNPGQLYRFDQTFKPVKNPHLWSNEDPYLYTVLTQVIDGKTITDLYSSPLGFRWFRWDYSENFLYVNGKKILIHGGNRQQDYPWLGDAVPKWITLMDLTDIAENMNYNFIRTAHYPNDRLVYDMTDKYGIVTDEELPNVKNQEFSQEVQVQQLKEMIRRDRNHPSIMFWSMGDETNHPVDSKFAVAEDSTRILTARKVTEGSAGVFIKHTDDNLPVQSLSRSTIRGWYNKDVKDLEPADGQQCGTEAHQQDMLKASGRFGTGNLCTWIYEDHGADGEYVNSPLLHVDPEGYVDVYRVPKYAYYFWQANFAKNPMVFIQPHNWRSKYLGQVKDFVVCSNCDKVELMVNGISKGYKLLDQSNFHSVTFNNITVETGAISVVASKDGKSVTTKVVMAAVPAKIVLSGSHKNIEADRGSVVIITADVVDMQGNHVYGAGQTIKWTISGPGKLVGPSVYESDINRNHMMDGVWYMDMPVSNVVRSTGKPGKIHISVSAAGLEPGVYDIEAGEVKRDNSIIAEPELQNEGRPAMVKIIVNDKVAKDIPREIKLTQEELNLGSSDSSGYAGMAKDYILKNNPSLDQGSVEFTELISVLASLLVNSSGHLNADDYNSRVDRYNNCRIISGYVNATKLPILFKEGLKKYYADIIIGKGIEKDAGDEMNWLNWIPSGGNVVIVTDEKPDASLKGVIFTRNTGLTEIIAAVYPQFVNFSDEAKERALRFVSKANPYIHVTSGNEPNVDEETANQTHFSCTVDKGQPILVPLLKFISE
jgi:beta-galactosidase